MRFNDYHKQVCAALKLEPTKSQELRTFMLRCFGRRLTANACIPLVRLEMEKRAAAEIAKKTA